MSDIAFQKAVQIVRDLPPNQIANEDKLNFYAFFKQATVGKNLTAKPAFWDVVGKAKWDQWTLLGNLSKDDAMAKYIQATVQCVQRLPNVDHARLLYELNDSAGPITTALGSSDAGIISPMSPRPNARVGPAATGLPSDTLSSDTTPSDTMYRNVSSAESMATVGVLLDSDMQEQEMPGECAVSLASRIELVSHRLERVEDELARFSERPKTWWQNAYHLLEGLSSQRPWQWLTTILSLLWLMQNKWLWRRLLQHMIGKSAVR